MVDQGKASELVTRLLTSLLVWGKNYPVELGACLLPLAIGILTRDASLGLLFATIALIIVARKHRFNELAAGEDSQERRELAQRIKGPIHQAINELLQSKTYLIITFVVGGTAAAASIHEMVTSTSHPWLSPMLFLMTAALVLAAPFVAILRATKRTKDTVGTQA